MSFPRWLQPLLHSALMRATDEWAIETKKIPSLDLMERAGEGLARIITEKHPGGRVLVVCGKGNNGGDGLVAARLLRQAGREVEVACLWQAQWMMEDARAQLERLPGDKPIEWDAAKLSRAHVVVDAMLGTGFADAPRDPVKSVIEAINEAGRPVVAADVPSGVDASTGEVRGVAIDAARTVTFHRAKTGHYIAPGKWHTGKVHVVEIGIPRGAPGEPDAGLIGSAVLRTLPRRTERSTKFDSGVVFVVGGSPGLTGAPTLAAMGAMRAGAGYVTIGAPSGIVDRLSGRLLEVMTVGLEDDSGRLSERALDDTLAAVGRADAVVLGPGIGRHELTQKLVHELLERIDVPIVLDADGLNAFSERIDDIARRQFPTILTPHSGELGRLLGISREEVDARRLETAREAAERSHAFVVLKGDDTLVVAPGGRTAISAGGAPALATAGTGDVLAGVIAAMLAKKLPPAHAACAAVYLHTEAGRIAAQPHGPDGVIASDVVAALPAGLKAS